MAELTKTALGALSLKTEMYSGAQIDTIKAELEGKLTAAIHYKGSVASFEALPTDAAEGDMYNVGSDLAGDNYVWTGSAWDKLAASFVLTKEATDAFGYVDEVTVNGTKVEIVENVLALTDVASAAALTAVDGRVTTLEGKVAALEAVPASKVVLTDSASTGKAVTGTFERGEDGSITVNGVASAAELKNAIDRIDGIVATGGEPNVINSVKVKDGDAVDTLIISEKAVTIDLTAYAKDDDLDAAEGRLDDLEALVDTAKAAAWTAKQDALSEGQLAACNSGVTADWKATNDAAVAAAATEADLTLAENRVAALEGLVDGDKVAAWDGKQAALDSTQMDAVNSGVNATWKGAADQDIADLKAASATHAAAADLTALKARVDGLAGLTALDLDADISSYDLAAKINAIIAAVVAG